MTPELIALLIAFVALLALDVPVAICLGLAAIVAVACIGDVPTAYLIAQRMATGIAGGMTDSPPVMIGIMHSPSPAARKVSSHMMYSFELSVVDVASR